MIDYYKVLGVSRNSNDIEIRKAFRRQALRFHPDRNKDSLAKKRFQQINEAFEILGDKVKRHQYDQQTNTIDTSYAAALFTHFFADYMKPRSVKRTLSLSLNDLYKGTTKKLKISRQGAPPAYLTLHVKRGATHGTTYTYKGQGDLLPSGQYQDIELEIQQKPHPIYQRRGDHLYTTLKLTLLEALTGFSRTLPRLDGPPITISGPPCAQPGQQLIVPGEGMPNELGKKGDLIVQLELPTLEQYKAILKQ